MCARWGGEDLSLGGQRAGDSAGHSPKLEQWGGQTAGALREYGREVWKNREWCDMFRGLSFPAAGQGHHRRRSCGVRRGALKSRSRACPWKRTEVGRMETVCRWS